MQEDKPIAASRVAAPIKRAITGTISSAFFEFQIAYKGRHTYVWSYDLKIINLADCPIHLRHIVEEGNASASWPTTEYSSVGNYSLWGAKPEVLPGETLLLEPAIAFDDRSGEFTDGTIPIWIVEQHAWLLEKLAVAHPYFSVDHNAARNKRVDLACLGDHGKLSFEGAHILLSYLRSEVIEKLVAGYVVLVNFSEIADMPISDSILLCLYLIHSSARGGRGEKTFDITSLMPGGINVTFISNSHFMARKKRESSASGDTVAAFLQISDVVLSPFAEKLLLAEKLLGADPPPSSEHLRQFVEAAPGLLRAIQADQPVLEIQKDRLVPNENSRLVESDVSKSAAEGKATSARPRWESRAERDLNLTPEEFVRKYYAVELAKVSPRPQWTESDEFPTRPAEFIARAYAPEMAAGTLHRGVLVRENRELPAKLASWLRYHSLPPGVDIPTKPEWNTRQIRHRTEAGGPITATRKGTPNSRLYQAMKRRPE